MPNYIFEKFEEVQESIRQNVSSIVYKYRADWKNTFHQKLVTEQIVWFAAPKDLNDPYDIRVPVKFDLSEIDHPIFLEKLQNSFKINNPGIAFTDRDLNVLCEKKFEEIKKDPKTYFETNYRQIREGEIYDRVGVFSCTSDGLNETMWAHYGNNNSGFAVGFNTVELSKNLFCSMGAVRYSDEIPQYNFINDNADEVFEMFLLKSKKWIYEKELRFFIIGDNKNLVREKRYSRESVIEFILGANFPKNDMHEIINDIRKIYTQDIPIYQARPKVSSFGLEKFRVD